MSLWKAKLQHQGYTFSSYFLVKEGRCPAEEFLAELDAGDRETSRKATAWLKRLADRGIPRNNEVCEYLERDLWELKPFPARLFFFRRGRNLYFTHGYKKKTRRLSSAELERARRMRDEFLSQDREDPA